MPILPFQSTEVGLSVAVEITLQTRDAAGNVTGIDTTSTLSVAPHLPTVVEATIDPANARRVLLKGKAVGASAVMVSKVGGIGEPLIVPVRVLPATDRSEAVGVIV